MKYDADKWTLIRFRLEVGTLVNDLPSLERSEADFAQHIMRLKKKLPGDGFHILLQKPFVVVGDESRETVQRRSTGTVKWAVDRLKRDYFTREPHDIIDIWLFKNEESYRRNTQQLFGQNPGTPFGSYLPRHRALVMNISTGGGTLVHEIVHPFMSADFPQCPSWFNEGLASLYEQCADKDGRIWGRTNWRLRGLQAAIHDDRVPSFKTLCGTSRREFYERDPGTNYSQARYLCYYLQEKGKLVEYYHEFRRASATDTTGYDTLVHILGEKDMEDFQDRWEQYVAGLRFP